MKLILIRTYTNGAGTNGILFTEQQTVICYTIELPWYNNFRRRSCIPEGQYELKIRFSKKYGHHIILPEVQNRNAILIHPANDAMQQLKGCIAPVTKLTGPGKGTQSKLAFNKLMLIVKAAMQAGPIFLTIKSTHNDN